MVAGATPIQSVGFVWHPEVSVNLLETKGARAQHSISGGGIEQDLRGNPGVAVVAYGDDPTILLRPGGPPAKAKGWLPSRADYAVTGNACQHPNRDLL